MQNALQRIKHLIRSTLKVATTALRVGRTPACLLLMAVSCGDASNPEGKADSVQSPVCTPPSDHPAPCWLTIDPGAGCQSFPDYVGCAVPFDASNPQPFDVQTKFLWSGSFPLQVIGRRMGACSAGVCPAGQICGFGDQCYTEKVDPERLSVLTGVVKIAGTPTAGVTVSVASDADYGSVLSEWGHFDPATLPLPAATGLYNLAVNAGTPVRLRFFKQGYIVAERTVRPIAGQYTAVPSVDLIAEPTTTVVNADSSGWQVVAGASETDAAGTRKARLFFPPSTHWTPVTGTCGGTPPACSTHVTQTPCRDAGCSWSGSACTGTPLPCAQVAASACVSAGCQLTPTANVSVREFTVGTTGPERMPGVLPPTSAYTYAIEALMKDVPGQEVHPVFNQPIIAYQENFLNLPIGWTVPAGAYDRVAGRWSMQLSGSTPLNGKIVKILSYTSLAADVDTDGNGVADNIGLTLGERQTLYSQYQPTTNLALWRVPLAHFSGWDFNFGGGLPLGAKTPEPQIDTNNPKKPCTVGGSIIECESQVLGESIPIPGTPYSLEYRSNRVPGYKPSRRVGVYIPGASIPTGGVAPTKLTMTFSAGGTTQVQVVNSPAGDQNYEFFWNGNDSFGRPANGAATATLRVGLTYATTYESTSQFSAPPGTTSVSTSAARDNITLWKDWTGLVGGLDASKTGLGGWTLNVQQAYSVLGKALYSGSGDGAPPGDVINAVAGKIIGSSSCLGGLDLPGSCGNPFAVAPGPDGRLYIAVPWATSGQNGEIRALNLDGTVSIVVPSTAGLFEPEALVVANDGTIYIADTGADKVFKWDGTALTTVAGTGAISPNSGDGLATSVNLQNPRGLALSPDGVLYIADSSNNKVRRLDPSGYLTVVAGTGAILNSGDEGNAILAQVGTPTGLAFAADGSLCIASQEPATGTNKGCIRCINPTGLIHRVAGGGATNGDGILATSATLDNPTGLAVGLDGSMYVTELSSYRVRKIAPNNIISTIVGTGSIGCTGEGVAPATGLLSTARGLAVDSKGRVYVADNQCGNVRRVSAASNPTSNGVSGEFAVPSSDGREVYVFDSTGRHLRTEDSQTGKVRFEFVYTSYQVQTGVFQKLLSQVRDRRGSTGSASDLVTQINRTTAGVPQTIVAPFGQTTTLQVTGGYLELVTFPSPLGSYDPKYTGPDGLLTDLTEPNGAVHKFEYATDGSGRLVKDRDPYTVSPNPAFKTLARSLTFPAAGKTSTVTVTTATGVVSAYTQVDNVDGSTTRIRENPDGTDVTSLIAPTNFQTVTFPDATTRSSSPIADPRFGLTAATSEDILKLVGATPKQLITRVDRVKTGGTGLYDFTTLTETRKIKKDAADAGLSYVTEVNKTGTPNYVLETTPALRMIKRELDTNGRVVKILRNHTPAEVAPINITYDTSGRVTVLSQGTPPSDRQTKFDWNATTGYLQYERKGTLASPSLFVSQFVTDAFGRQTEVFRNTSTNGTQFKLGYDNNGNPTSISIPTGSPTVFSVHSQPHLLNNLIDTYDPPNVSGVSPDIVDYRYDDAERRLNRVAWATSAKGFDLVYEAVSGKLDKKTHIGAGGTVLSDYTYDPTTGKLSSITSGSVVTSYSYSGVQGAGGANYDGLLGKTSTTWSASQKDVTFTYDNYLRVLTESVAGGQIITYGYDNDGLVTSAAVGALGTIDLSCAVATPDPACRSPQSGRVQKFTVGVVKTILGYDPTFGDATSFTTTCTGATCAMPANCNSSGGVNTCFKEALTYDSLARILTRTDTVRSALTPATPFTYGYDFASRLSTITGGATATYVYDAGAGNDNGNRTSAPGQTLTFDAQDRISTVGYTHDFDGRRTSPNSGTTTYAYDDFGQLVTATLSATTSIQFTYDGLGRRVTRKKVVSGVTQEERRYLYAQDNRLVAMYDNAGILQQQYVYATGGHVPDAAVIGGVLYRVVSDHLGSVRMVVKASDGTVVQATAYDAWGNVLAGETASIEKVPFGFAGGLRDIDIAGTGGTGLVQMGVRWYDPVTGRWITKDPIRFDGGFNLYAYSWNDPINFRDAGGSRPEGTGSWDFASADLPKPKLPTSGAGLSGAGIGVCALDGPAPVADTIGIPAIIAGLVWLILDSAPESGMPCGLWQVQEGYCVYQCANGTFIPVPIPKSPRVGKMPPISPETANDNICPNTINPTKL